MKQSNLSRIARRFARHRLAVAGLIVLAILVIMAVFAPLIAPYSPTEVTKAFGEPPSAAHILGTDKVSRDMFSRILYAMRSSLLVGFLATLISTSIGVALGLVSGYFGGWLDRAVMSFTDMVTSVGE